MFDEAHHAPAPSYRKLLTSLRDRCKDMLLLGMTATPLYSNEKLQGWLNKLFPQGILYQVTPQYLMAQGILAQPVPSSKRPILLQTSTCGNIKNGLGHLEIFLKILSLNSQRIMIGICLLQTIMPEIEKDMERP
ncbi:DEAD/DEAH box helicase family protein [Methanothrix soehngenii]|uniref:DEAD/DEAH box helicase family protein n=1 Tax=Methanothrix soehngenii TaxID=2223 RepID=UPI003AB96240